MAFLAPLAASLLPSVLGKIFHFKDGGMVKGGKMGKAQVAVVHTGERVLTPAQNKVYENTVMKNRRRAPTATRPAKPRKTRTKK
jgi:hypothetical protein